MITQGKDKNSSASSSLFSVKNILEFFAVLFTISAFITKLKPAVKEIYWLPWLLIAIFYIFCRLAQHFQVLEIKVGNSHSHDLNHLEHRLYGFKVDSPFWEMAKNVNQYDKLPISFVELLGDLYERYQVDFVELRNRKLQKASQKFIDALKSYIDKLDDELFHEGPWYLLPESKRREEPLMYQEYSKQLNTLRRNLITTYGDLTNLISKLGGDIRTRVDIAS